MTMWLVEKAARFLRQLPLGERLHSRLLARLQSRSLLLICLVLSWSLVSCASQSRQIRLVDLPDVPNGSEVRRLSGPISEVAPPAIFLDLAKLAPDQQPQVAIASPQPDQIIEDTQLTVKLEFQNFSIYKDETLALGPHVQLMLDNQPARSIYSLEETITFEDLAPGSHMLRAIAVRPWGESFKNETAYAQTRFHVFAQTNENTPDPDLPLLTFIEPQGTFSAEPLLLDFYLTNAPLHMLAQADAEDDLPDWKIRAAVNGKSFVFDQWQPLYLKGFKPGKSWLQLTLIDEQGQPIENVFNSTVRVVDYDPTQQTALAKLTRGELSLSQAGQIVDPDYQPPVEVPAEVPAEVPVEVPAETLPDELETPQTDRLEVEASEIKALETESLEAEEPETEVEESEARGTETVDAGAEEIGVEETGVEETGAEEIEKKEIEGEETEVRRLEAEYLEIDETRAEGFETESLETESPETEDLESDPEAVETPIERRTESTEADAMPERTSLFGRFFGKNRPVQPTPAPVSEPLIAPDSEAVVEPLPSESIPPEPTSSEPVLLEPEVTEPVLLEPEVTEPEVTEPEVIEPEVTEPEATEPIPSTLNAPVDVDSALEAGK